MRIPKNLPDFNFEEDARVKFLYYSPELKQNVEVSLDGNDTTLEALVDAFQRFVGALGIILPENTAFGLVELEDEDDEDEEEATKD